jgi:hypothetical protein
MTAIEDIKYLQKQGRLTLDMNTRAILELWEEVTLLRKDLFYLNEAVEVIKNNFGLQADTDEVVHLPDPED